MQNFLDGLASVNGKVNNVVWGVPALILLIGTGILMTVVTRFFQFTRFGHMWKNTIGGLFKHKAITKSDDRHSISQFQALCTAGVISWEAHRSRQTFMVMDLSANGMSLTLKLSRIGSFGMMATPAPVVTEGIADMGYRLCGCIPHLPCRISQHRC